MLIADGRDQLLRKLKVDAVEGRLVDYFDKALDCWVPAKIIEIDGETGFVRVNVNPDQALNSQDQKSLLRPRTTPSQPKLERLQAFCRDGRIDEELATIFNSYAVAGTGSGLVIYQINLAEVGVQVDEFLGISGSVQSLQEMLNGSSGRTLCLDRFAEVFWNLVKRVQREHGEAILREPARNSARTKQVKDAYRFERGLGSGTYGEVFFARCVHTGARRAIKSIAKGNCWGSMEQEMKILLALDHPHIIKLYEQFEDRQKVYLVTDFCSGGDLEKTIKERQKSGYAFSESYISDVMNQTLMAIAHVHARGILHLDLKPANIMLMPKKGTLPPSKNASGQTLQSDLKPHVMVIDLGVADLFKPGNFGDHKPCGSPAYMAPEVWSGVLTPKADIFSLGVMLFQLLSFSRPYPNTPTKTGPAISFWRQHPEPNWSLMPTADRSDIAISTCRNMLRIDRHTRPSASKCLQTRFIKEGSNIGMRTRPQILQGFEKYIRRLSLLPQRSVLHHSIALALARAWPANQLPTIKCMFEELDADRTGRLDPVRSKDILKRWGLSDDNAEAVAYAMDLNRDGSVGWTEFVAACIDPGDKALEEDLKRIFHEADTNRDGSLSKRELVDLLAADRLSEQTAQNIFDALAKCNGNVDWPSFQRFLETASEVVDLWEPLGVIDEAGEPTGEVCNMADDDAQPGHAHQARILTPRVSVFAESPVPLQQQAQSFVSQANSFFHMCRGVMFPTEVDNSLLEANLIALNDMGLSNREKNAAALKKYRNTISNELLDELLREAHV
jgi:calcium-dependent protein kinase